MPVRADVIPEEGAENSANQGQDSLASQVRETPSTTAQKPLPVSLSDLVMIRMK